MIYATGGLAYGEAEHNWGGYYETNNYGGTGYHKNSSSVDFGWVAGGGVEFLHSQNFSIKAEALWIRFDNDSKDFDYEYTHGYWDRGRWKEEKYDKKARFSHDDDMVVVRVGLNYKFGDRTPVYEPLK
jgi:opacity protein-like surface antigen